ncbi:MAG: AMP nucleosidase [Gammaproteobacteria bacterium]|nr:AMP nucleosidase [Gammaproteobacteria bacterium]
MATNSSREQTWDDITEKTIALSMLERYTGSKAEDFQPYILLVNFFQYIEYFSEKTGCEVYHGSTMSVAHCKKNKITMIDFGLGSPSAALIIKLISFLKTEATLLLGMCGGLRPEYQIGEYFNPVAAIREEGTSYAYLPARCPSLSSFVIQRYVCRALEKHRLKYYTGVIHTTNVRFWEFDTEFTHKLLEERVNAIDMECATLFTVGFVSSAAVGALMLISDMPLSRISIKNEAIVNEIFTNHMPHHIKTGIEILVMMRKDKGKYKYNF